MKENASMKQTHGRKGAFKFFICGVCLISLCLMESVFAACVDDLSNIPMETKVQPAPANVMFILDNSGSMDREFMTSEYLGIFKGESYLYPDSSFTYGQNRYYSNQILEGDEQKNWKSQWAGYNKIFFNPHADYQPWPKKADADTSQPWADPKYTSGTSSKFKMGNEYFSKTTGSGGTVSIKNAHYFVIDDKDEDGVRDTEEDIFLVNFVSGIRAYYLFDDDGDDVVENGELFLKTGSEIPAGVKASLYDEEGDFSSFKTNAQDLQNFANWFSYYRKRSLTGKAAVAGAIYNLDWVYVGFYTILSELRQAVLPIGVETTIPGGTGAEIVVDNGESGYTERWGDEWNGSSASNSYKTTSVYTKEDGNWARFTPNIPEDGKYKVYIWYTKAGNDRDKSADYKIIHDGATTTKTINQNINYSEWVEIGEYTFNKGTSGYVQVTHYGNDATSADAVKFVGAATSSTIGIVDETDTLLNLLYNMDSDGNSTPLRKALLNVGRYYHKNETDESNIGPSPFVSAADGGACQQAFSILITDGFWNGGSPEVGNQDKDTSSIFAGAPYADDYDNTLADVAMKYYKTDLAPALDDVVPTNSCDPASHQHMVTYGVSFGVKGTLDPTTYHSCLLDGSKPPWPEPSSGNIETVDDLYHASVNGRGLFFSAGDPQELVSSLVAVTANIASRISSGSSVSVNGEELNSGTTLYQASYASDSWTGDVTAYPVDPDTGEIKKEEKDIKWHASEQLQALLPANRNIVTYDSLTGSGVEFTYGDLSEDQKKQMHPTDAAIGTKVVSFIRGEEISGFRSRTKRLADIIHSAPLLMGTTLYAGSNDGMLHAFDAETGNERFAYIPNLVMHNYYNPEKPEESFYEPGYQHRFFVDLTPFARSGVDPEGDSSSAQFTYLVGGLGKGGIGYYCLDITDADTKTHTSPVADIEKMVKWEYPTNTTPQSEIADIGYSYSMPIIVKSNLLSLESTDSNPKYKWVIIFGNGYGSTDGSSALFILGLDGKLIKKIDTGDGFAGCNGLSTPSVIDVNNDLKADFVYAGDLKGNLWKFDLTSSDVTKWDVAHKDSGGLAAPFFSVPGKAITSKPDVRRHCEFNTAHEDLKCATDKYYTPGYMVMFGTGKYLNETDRTSTASEYVFGLWDYGDDGDDREYLGTFDPANATQLSNMDPKIKLLEQKEEDSSGIYNGVYLRILTANEPVWDVKCDATSGQDPDPDPDKNANAGWFFELNDGERVIKDVIIRDNNLIYLTFKPDVSPCSGGGNSIIHEVNSCTGGRLSAAQFDINNDRSISDDDMIEVEVTDPTTGEKVKKKVPPTGKKKAGLLHMPVFIQFQDKPVEMKIFSTSAAATETIYEVAEPRGLFYWRTH